MLKILEKGGIVIDGVFYDYGTVKTALAGVKGEKVAISGNTAGEAVITVPTKKGILIAYDSAGGDVYPGINVDIVTRDEEGKTVIGLATVECIQTKNDGIVFPVKGGAPHGGLAIRAYSAIYDEPVYDESVVGQENLAPQTEADLSVAAGADEPEPGEAVFDKRMFNLVLETPCIGTPDTDVAVLNFLTSYKTAEEALAAARAAVIEYLGTEEGKRNVQSNYGGAFDWGDAGMDVPEAMWKKHGLDPVFDNKLDVGVMHDASFTDV